MERTRGAGGRQCPVVGQAPDVERGRHLRWRGDVSRGRQCRNVSADARGEAWARPLRGAPALRSGVLLVGAAEGDGEGRSLHRPLLCLEHHLHSSRTRTSAGCAAQRSHWCYREMLPWRLQTCGHPLLLWWCVGIE